MNALLQDLQDPRRLRFEADLAARVTRLFQRCPLLAGFSVYEDDAFPSCFACYPALAPEEADEVLAEIAQMLADLFEEEPEASELVLGRTFARTLH